MKHPRVVSAGPTITRANVQPGGNDIHLIDQSASAVQSRISRAALIDREADFQLLLGHHATAERLSHRAFELREALA
jgi:hypothetical protein